MPILDQVLNIQYYNYPDISGMEVNMGNLELSDLYNPRNIKAIYVVNKKQCEIICADDDQGFQEYPRSFELWQKLSDGRLLRVQRWLKKSITNTFDEAQIS